MGVVLIALAAWTLLPAPQPPLPTVDLRARPRLAALDSFDHVVRPFAVRYAPVRFDDARAIEPTLAVEVTPGLRPEPQPMRVLHNGRFSLPAGNYRVRVRWAAGDPLPARGPTAIALQVGRIGPPLRQWPVTPSPGASWDAEFWLPVDAGFVGFRGTPGARTFDRRAADRGHRRRRRRRPHTDAAGARRRGIRRHDRALPRRAHVSGVARVLDRRRAGACA